MKTEFETIIGNECNTALDAMKVWNDATNDADLWHGVYVQINVIRDGKHIGSMIKEEDGSVRFEWANGRKIKTRTNGRHGIPGFKKDGAWVYPMHFTSC